MKKGAALATRLTADLEIESLGQEAAQRLLDQRVDWTVEEYFELETQRRMEYSDGRIEVLPVATEIHQAAILFILESLKAFARKFAPGTVLFSGLRVQLWEGKFDQPDLVYMKKENDHRRHDEFWEGADLVMEVVSKGSKNRKRDLQTKRRDYAKAGIGEYWVIDPKEETITVFVLDGNSYHVHGRFARGERATSVVLPGFGVKVAAVFEAGQRKAS